MDESNPTETVFKAIVRCTWEYIVRNPKLLDVSQSLKMFSGYMRAL